MSKIETDKTQAGKGTGKATKSIGTDVKPLAPKSTKKATPAPKKVASKKSSKK